MKIKSNFKHRKMILEIRYKALRMISRVDGSVFYYNVQRQYFEPFLTIEPKKNTHNISDEKANQVIEMQLYQGIIREQLRTVYLQV